MCVKMYGSFWMLEVQRRLKIGSITERESIIAFTVCPLQLAGNSISVQERAVNLKYYYELRTQSGSWWSWKKIIKESQQEQRWDFLSSFPAGFLSLSLVVKAQPRHYLFWPLHLRAARVCFEHMLWVHTGTLEHHSVNSHCCSPFPLWIPNERIMLLSSQWWSTYSSYCLGYHLPDAREKKKKLKSARTAVMVC